MVLNNHRAKPKKFISISRDNLPDIEIWMSVLAILTIGFLAHFLYFRQFGLFQDDWNVFGKVRAELSPLFNIFFFNHRRPLARVTIYAHNFVFSFVQNWYWGYLHPYLTISISAFLFFLLIRIRLPFFFALVGSILFVVYPTDTTHPWLTIIVHRMAIAVSLLSVWLLYKKQYIISAVLLLCSGLIYESGLLLYPLAFLFLKRQDIKRFVIIYSGTLAIYLGWRLMLRPWYISASPEQRLNNFNWDLTPLDIVNFVGYMPLSINFFTANYVLIQRTLSKNGMPILALLVIAIVFVVLLMWALSRYTLNLTRVQKHFKVRNKVITLDLNTPTFHAIGLMILGLVMVMYSYLFVSLSSYVARAEEIIGSFSRLNYPATPGTALTIASFLFFIFSIFRPIWERAYFRFIFVCCISLYLTMLVNFHYGVQLDYVQAWKLEKGYWYQLIANYDHLQDETVVIVEIDDFDYFEYRRSSAAWPLVWGWPMSDAIQSLYKNQTLSSFPSVWAQVFEDGVEVRTDRGGPRLEPYSNILWLQYNSQSQQLQQKKVFMLEGGVPINITNEHITATSDSFRGTSVVDYFNIVNDEPSNEVNIHLEVRRLFEDGKMWYMAGEYNRAIDNFEQAIELAPNGPLYAWLGRAYQANGRPYQALMALQQAEPLLSPNNENLYNFVTNTHRLLEDEPIITLYQQTLDDPNNSDLRFRMAEAFASQSLLNEAGQQLHRIIELDPGSESAKRAQQILDLYE